MSVSFKLLYSHITFFVYCNLINVAKSVFFYHFIYFFIIPCISVVYLFDMFDYLVMQSLLNFMFRL